jgi:LysM repeat protein
MLGKAYKVKFGDTLWDISQRELGNASRWPELFEHNNSQMVSAKTGFKIVDPDLIFIGQTLYIPGQTPGHRAPPAPRVPSAKPLPNAGKAKAKPKVRSIPLEYSFDDISSITIMSGNFEASIKLKGSVTIQAKDAIEFATITQNDFKLKTKSNYDHAFGKLVTGSEIGFNPKTNEVNFEFGITSHASHPSALSTKLSAGISSKTGTPCFKGNIIAPSIKGVIDGNVYVTNDLNVEIEISARPPSAKPKLVPVPIPSAKPIQQRKEGWDYLLGGALVAGAGIIIVATLAEDIVTLGAGVADDVPSFALASAMFASGIAMFKTINGGVPIAVEGQGVEQNSI